MRVRRRWCLFLALAACLVALPAPAAVRIQRLVVEGGEAAGVSRQEVLAAVRSRPAFWGAKTLDPAVLAEDEERLRRLYQERGYFDVQVASEVTYLDEERAVVTIRVTPGEPVRVHRLTVSCPSWPAWFHPLVGEPAATLPLTAVLPEVGLYPGDIFQPARYEAIKKALARFFADHGHATVQVRGEATVYRREHQADLVFQVDPGPRWRVGDIRITGNQRTAEFLIRRELHLRPGDYFSLATLMGDQRRLHDLDLFQQVRIRPRPEEAQEDRLPLEVEVKEKPPRGVKLGIGYGAEELLRGLAEIRWRNFLGRGYTGALQGRASSLGYRLAARLDNPRLLGQEDLHLSWEVGSRLQDLDAYRNQQYYSRVAVRRPWLVPGLTLHLAQNLEENDTTEVDPAVLAEARQRFGRLEEETFFVSSLEGGIRWTTVAEEERLDPHRGLVLEYTLEGTARLLGSEFQFLRQESSVSWYQPLADQVVFAARLHLGTVDPVESDDYVPIAKRFFTGGSRSLRGYAYQDVGDKDVAGQPLGGLSLFEAGVELRFPLVEKLRGVLFCDGGNVFRDPYRIDGADLLYGAGVGLRYQTPVGPVRLDLAYKVNPPAEETRRFRLHFNLGHAF